MVSQIPTSSKFHFKKSNSGGHPIPSKHAAIPLGIKEIMDGAFFACRQEHEQPAPIHALKAMSDSEVQPHAWRCNDLVGLAPYTVADGSAQVSVLAPHAPMSPPPRAAWSSMRKRRASSANRLKSLFTQRFANVSGVVSQVTASAKGERLQGLQSGRRIPRKLSRRPKQRRRRGVRRR